jgi:hypothetical protein
LAARLVVVVAQRLAADWVGWQVQAQAVQV